MRLKNLSVKNYRTLEDISFDFSGDYSSVCGRNNCGKSNLIRAIRILFGDKGGPFSFEDDVEISHRADFTAWKKEKDGVYISGDIDFSTDTDQGLSSFIESMDSEKLGHIDTQTEKFELTVKVNYHPEEARMEKSIIINGSKIDNEIISQEIYKKLRSTIIFHNSTHSKQFFFSRRRRLHGLFSRIPQNSKSKLDKKAKEIRNELNRIFKDHAHEIEEMLDRLGEKLEVRLFAPDFDLDEYPFEISLGNKNLSVPLDDWGSGTRNQTLILNSIFDAKRAAKVSEISERVTPLILIEEPEAFLHPLAQAHFSNVLQDIAKELKIQVITTTHSPYFLSHEEPTSNILLCRDKLPRSPSYGSSRIEPTGGENWKKPFEHALGIVGPEFDIFKSAIFSNSNTLIMVEGDTDKEYLELCRDTEHGRNALTPDGEIFVYNGCGTLTGGNHLLKFIRDRFSRVIITFDLDAIDKVEKTLKGLGFEKDKSYFAVGLDIPGKREIEGLLPDRIKEIVHSAHPELINALISDRDAERKKAKKDLKKKYLEAFRGTADIKSGDYSELYKVCRKINKALKSA